MGQVRQPRRELDRAKQAVLSIPYYGGHSPAVEVGSVAPGDRTKAQAEETCRSICADLNVGAERIERGARTLLEFKESGAWKSLGYRTWKACVEARFALSLRRVNQLIEAERSRVAEEDPEAAKNDPEEGSKLDKDVQKTGNDFPSDKKVQFQKTLQKQGKVKIGQIGSTCPISEETVEAVAEDSVSDGAVPERSPAPAEPRRDLSELRTLLEAAEAASLAFTPLEGEVGLLVAIRNVRDRIREALRLLDASPSQESSS